MILPSGGLVVDKLRGNIFKMDSHRHVGKVYHGFRQLEPQEAYEYRTESIRLNTTARFALIDTLFALPEAFLYAALVDYLETTQPGREHDWLRLFEDIRYCIDLAHRDGSIKTAIMADTPRYVERDGGLARALHKLRSAGKRLFVLTNSFAPYTQHIMSYLLDEGLPEYPSWRTYFDIVVTASRKPFFFAERNPFLVVDATGRVLGEEYQGLGSEQIYQGGNRLDFERMSGFSGEKILYIGDHIYGDIVRSRKASAWRTVMVVQEMEDELDRYQISHEQHGRMERIEEELAEVSYALTHDVWIDEGLEAALEAMEAGGPLPAGGPSVPQPVDVTTLGEARKELRAQGERLRRRRRELLDRLLECERRFEANFNPWWGLIFKQGNKNSIFGEQVADYACLYTSRVANFSHYSPLHYFRAPREPMAHERT